MLPHNPVIDELNTLRPKVTEILLTFSAGPSILNFIMSPETPAGRRDVHIELAKLEKLYLEKAPGELERLSHRLRNLNLGVDEIPLTPEQREATITNWQQAADHARTAIHKLRYMFEIGGPVADWRAISRELDASASPFREFSRNLDTWLRNLHLGRHADGTPRGLPGGTYVKRPGPPTAAPPAEPPQGALTPEQKQKLRDEIERRRHLPFAEQLRLTAKDYEEMVGIFKKQHPDEVKKKETKPSEVDLPAEEYETDDEGNIKEDRWGRPLKKVRVPTTPEEFATYERDEDRRFEESQQRWVSKVINKLDSMSKFTRLNKLLDADEPFGIFLGSVVATKYKFGSMALKAVRQAKGVIGKTSGGYLVMRNLPVLGVSHGSDPQEALRFLQESTSRVLDKQRRWARFWFICSTPALYRAGHDYYLLWPKTLGDDVHKGHFTQWQFNLTDNANADAGTKV